MQLQRALRRLVFVEASQGTLQLHYSSNGPVRGALACFEPTKPVPKFKLQDNGGQKEIMRGVGGPNAVKFYEAWTHFVKEGKGFDARFMLLSNHRAKPVAIYFSDATQKVTRSVAGRGFDLRTVTSVAVVPEASDCYKGVGTMQPNLFKQNGVKAGGAAIGITSSGALSSV